jgi:branched-chain amino acid transport system substrate-binding protein
MLKRVAALSIAILLPVYLLPPRATLAAEPIKIGALLTYSGVYASIGEEMTNAMELAFSQIGNTVEGRPIQIIRADTEAKPNIALQKAKELVGSDNVDFLVGPVSSGEGVALRDFVAQSKIPMLAPNALADELTREKCSPYIIPLGFSTLQFTKPIGEWLPAHGVKTVYTLAPDYVGPHQIMDTFARYFTKAGGKVVGAEFTPFGKTNDFAPYLAKAKDAKPDAIFAFYAGGEGINFVKQAADFRIQDSMKLSGPGWTVSPLFLPAEGDAAAGFIGLINYAPTIDTPENKAFQTAFQAKYKKTASEFGAQAYDTAKFIIAAVTAMKGKTDDHTAMAKALRATKITGPRGPISIDAASDHVVQNMYIVKIEKTASGPQMSVVDTIPQVKDEPSVCKLEY